MVKSKGFEESLASKSCNPVKVRCSDALGAEKSNKEESVSSVSLTVKLKLSTGRHCRRSVLRHEQWG